MSPTAEELRHAEEAFASAIGHVVMEAGNLEYQVRLLGMYVTEERSPDLHKKLQTGGFQGSTLIKEVRAATELVAPTPLYQAVAVALAEIRSLLDQRNDLAHSAWRANVFQDTPEPFRKNMRRLAGDEEQTPLPEIWQLHSRMVQARRQLKEAFVDLFFEIQTDGGGT